jgi:tRNA G10  N-methylase Trm11
MHKYAFILGRKFKLSIAELFAVFGKGNVEIVRDVFVKGFDKPLAGVQDFQDSLGGVVKIGEIFDEADNFSGVENKILDYLSALPSGKLTFAISVYNLPPKNENFLKNLLINVKKGLKGHEGKVRFLNKPNQNLKSVVIYEERLDEKGTDLSLIFQNGKYLIAKTISVQDFKSYSIRDYDRPSRDAKSGMLPPKLAQMMINLACGNDNNCTVYDPFCGSGTILMEGTLMGHKVMGSDISEKAILDTKTNLEWLKREFKIEENSIIDIFEKDASTITKKDLKVLPDCIVSETYLGPPISKIPDQKTIHYSFNEVEEILTGALKNFAQILKKGSKIVIAVPFYLGERNIYIDDLPERIHTLGFQIEKQYECTKRGSLLYDRENQLVGREIFVLKLY